MKKELNIQKSIMIAVSAVSRVFRNNVGTGWTGNVSNTNDNGKFIANARPLRAGLCKGSSDLIGWTSKKITPDMVGKKIAVFTALEVKTPTGKPSAEQVNFLNVVNAAGGIAGIVRSPEDALELVNK